MAMSVIARHLTGQAGLGSPGVDELRWLRPVYPGDTVSSVSSESLSSVMLPHSGRASSGARPAGAVPSRPTTSPSWRTPPAPASFPIVSIIWDP